jgi:uncharacterized phosphosugar-binding protein
MLYNRLFCLTCVFLFSVCFSACRTTKPAVEKSANMSDAKAAGATVEKRGYANDIERLNILTEKINKACRGNYLVVFGGERASSGRNVVNIDYALFDRLSDDGAAVLITEAIVPTLKLPSQSQVQKQTDIQKDVLLGDENVGLYVGRAGFKSDGFAKWLKAKEMHAGNLQQANVPDKIRIEAFMRGYLSANSRR